VQKGDGERTGSSKKSTGENWSRGGGHKEGRREEGALREVLKRRKVKGITGKISVQCAQGARKVGAQNEAYLKIRTNGRVEVDRKKGIV